MNQLATTNFKVYGGNQVTLTMFDYVNNDCSGPVHDAQTFTAPFDTCIQPSGAPYHAIIKCESANHISMSAYMDSTCDADGKQLHNSIS